MNSNWNQQLFEMIGRSMNATQRSKAASTNGSLYKCGIHNYETATLNDWNLHLEQFAHQDQNGNLSKAASALPEEEMVTISKSTVNYYYRNKADKDGKVKQRQYYQQKP